MNNAEETPTETHTETPTETISNSSLDEADKKDTNLKKIKNKGTGAGGSNTNKNGLEYETKKDLSTEYDIVENVPAKLIKIDKKYKIIRFNEYPENVFITGPKGGFMKLLDPSEDKRVPRLHGTKEPDNWFIIDDNIFIIEMKFQNGGGSVCEKLQTATHKRRNLRDRYPDKKIHYMYVLSGWFRKNCAAEIHYLKIDGIIHFWGDNVNFKNEIIKYMMDSL